MSFFISSAFANASPVPEASPFPPLIMLGVFLLFFYFMVLRPQSKRQKEHQALVSQLDKGDEVIMSGGLMGKVVKVDDQYASIEIANNVQVKVQKSSVLSTLPKGTLKAI